MELNEAIQRLQALCRQGDAKSLHQEMFAPEAALCGEGASSITVGADLLPALTEMLKVTPQLSIRSVRTEHIADGAAITWLAWSSPTPDGQPGETIAFRSLAAWKRQGSRWLIVADMYAFGAFTGV